MQTCRSTTTKNKVDTIKKSIVKSSTDPLSILREAFLKWRPDEAIQTFHLKEVSVGEVRKLLENLKNSQAYGHDEIDGSTMKLGAAVLAKPVAHIINLSLATQTFPAKWKLGRVLPLLKSNDANKNCPSSYRPVTQLSLTSKLTEKCVQQQLLEFLENTGQLSQDHHGYRKFLSTTTALVQAIDTIGDAIDNNAIASTMCVDMSAAFDCVEHALLLSKLEYYHLGDDVKNWIKSYLEFRSTYVSIGSANSEMIPVKHGVPQGSVLGPLLFLLYTNDFPSAINDDLCANQAHKNTKRLFGDHCPDCGTLPLYADDALYISVNSSRMSNQLNIERSFANIREYLNMNGLQINEAKTTLTEYMSRQKRIRLNGIPPELTVREVRNEVRQDKHILDRQDCRILGANLKNDMTWDLHLYTGKKAVIPGVRQLLGALYRISNTLSKKAKLQITNALIISKMSYLITLWGNSNPTLIKKVQVTQNLAARFISGLKRTTRRDDLMRSCNWLRMDELTNYYSAVQIWKTLRHYKPLHLRDKLQEEDDSRISTDNPRLRMTETAFRCKSVVLWNKLPSHLRTEVSIRKFKAGVKSWLLERRTNNIVPD